MRNRVEKNLSRHIETFDYVIIGSGSAGSALAYRLGEDIKTHIAIAEFGGIDIGPFIQMPAALSYPMNMGLYYCLAHFTTKPRQQKTT